MSEELNPIKITIDKIKIGDNRRRISDDKVRELAESIREIGLLNAISINKDFVLIAGFHRIMAFIELGEQEIPANIMDLPPLDCELAEIDENLKRNELTVLEQGECLLRREAILKEKGLRAESGSNQFTQRGGAPGAPPQTTESLASKIGISKRSFQERKQIAGNIIPEVKDAIFNTELANSKTKLLEIARMEPEKQMEAVSSIEKKPHVANNSGNNEWYTPCEFIESARFVMGSIDTDPASSDIANETVRASQYFTVETDGLKQEWMGNVWMNPPYSAELIKQFSEAIVEKYESGEINQATILVNNATETNWFQTMANCASVICFPKSRIRFLDTNGKPTGAPLQGQAILYMGDRPNVFTKEFEKYGFIANV